MFHFVNIKKIVVAITPVIAGITPALIKSAGVGLQRIKTTFMDTYTLRHNLEVFGFRVTTFPGGVEQAFTKIMQSLGDSPPRSYYGLSNMDEKGNILYYAAAEEKFAREAELSGFERYTIPKGQYLAVTLHDWLTKTDCIKDIFHEMMQDSRADLTKQCIEWYKDDHEMVCMLQKDPVKELFTDADAAAKELLALLQPLTEEEINSIPFEGSWTPAQLATHVTKSNNAIVQAMDMEGHVTDRKPTERVGELKKIFLDFNHRLKSPGFIVPKPGLYEKGKLVTALKKSNELLQQKRAEVNLAEVIEFSAFGQISRLELFHFVLYHTQRHVHQLKNILNHLK